MYYQHQLKNGIRLIHKYTNTRVGHFAVLINVGSRDEEAHEYGLAHLIEHCLFKGTEKRKSFHILNRIDGVGGELNAYTTKEETCLYASFLTEHYERSIELLSDLIFHSVFKESEIAKEKDVIIDEINSYKDAPVELIYDEFEEFVYRDHGMGHQILGQKASLKKYTAQDLLQFIQKNYHTENMVLSSVGNIEFSKLVRLCEKYFEEQSSSSKLSKRRGFKDYKPFEIQKSKKTHQTHVLLGNIAYHYSHPSRVPFILLNNYLGGPAMNSRLNLMIREKYGFTYHLESLYTPFSDTGLFTIYAGVLHSAKDKTLSLILKELELLRNNKMKEGQLKKAQIQLIGQIAIGMDSTLNEMLSIGKSCLIYEKVETLEELSKQIMQIQPEQILEVANEVFEKSNISFLTYTR